MNEHFDVVVIGAGLSGIDAAHHLQSLCPNKSYIILEERDRIGGTWDLFRYPGIRSDSDMLTMGYSFRPWTSPATSRRGHPRVHRRHGAGRKASTAISGSATRFNAPRGPHTRRSGLSTRCVNRPMDAMNRSR